MIYENYYVSKLFLKNVINVGVLIFMVLFWIKYILWYFYLCIKYWDDFIFFSKMLKKKK